METLKPVENFINHYQKTAELNHDLRKERNRLFLILLGVIALATILTFRIQQTHSLLVFIIAKTLSISDILLLGALLLVFLSGKVMEDLQSNTRLLLAEVPIAIVNVIFYIGYIIASLGLGNKNKNMKQLDRKTIMQTKI
jgi:Mn2+/Fe2+ NRAMP family transporter